MHIFAAFSVTWPHHASKVQRARPDFSLVRLWFWPCFCLAFLLAVTTFYCCCCFCWCWMPLPRLHMVHTHTIFFPFFLITVPMRHVLCKTKFQKQVRILRCNATDCVILVNSPISVTYLAHFFGVSLQAYIFGALCSINDENHAFFIMVKVVSLCFFLVFHFYLVPFWGVFMLRVHHVHGLHFVILNYGWRFCCWL